MVTAGACCRAFMFHLPVSRASRRNDPADQGRFGKSCSGQPGCFHTACSVLSFGGSGPYGSYEHRESCDSENPIALLRSRTHTKNKPFR